MNRPLLLAMAIVAFGAIGLALQEQPRRGGPAGTFLSQTPDHDLSVVQGNPSATSLQLSVLAPKATSVTYRGPGKANPESLTLKPNEPQQITLTGLSPNATADYALIGPELEFKGRITTPRKPGQAFTFAIQADSHLDENSATATYQNTLNQIAKDNPDFLVDLGDTFMTGKQNPFTSALPQYIAQHYWFGIVGRSAPIFLTLGNHDGEQGWIERNQTSMTSWAASQRKSFFPPIQGSGNTATANHYDVKWGDVQIFVLDPFSFTTQKPGQSGDNWLWTLGKNQYAWLSQTLAKSTAKYRFVFIHHLVGGNGKDARGGTEFAPFFEWGGRNLDGTDGFKTKRPDFPLPIHDLLSKYGAQAVFRGHDHLYVRQEYKGMIYQLVPQPSHARGDSTRSAADYGYTTGKILSSSGYLRVSITPTKAIITYIKSGTAQTPDSYELSPVTAPPQ